MRTGGTCITVECCTELKRLNNFLWPSWGMNTTTACRVVNMNTTTALQVLWGTFCRIECTHSAYCKLTKWTQRSKVRLLSPCICARKAMSAYLFFLFHRFNICLCLQAGKTDPSVFASTDISHNSFFTFLNVTHYVYDNGIPGTSFGELVITGVV